MRSAWEVKQRRMYLKVRDETRISVIKDGVHMTDESADILKRLLRLVQVASNPNLVDEAYEGTPGKWEVLSELVANIIASNEKVIVWTSFTENAEWLNSSLRKSDQARSRLRWSCAMASRIFVRLAEKPLVDSSTVGLTSSRHAIQPIRRV